MPAQHATVPPLCPLRAGKPWRDIEACEEREMQVTPRAGTSCRVRERQAPLR
jgi:hypothetical protein